MRMIRQLAFVVLAGLALASCAATCEQTDEVYAAAVLRCHVRVQLCAAGVRGAGVIQAGRDLAPVCRGG